MKNDNSNNSNYREEDQPNKESAISSMDSRFNQTLRNVQGYAFQFFKMTHLSFLTGLGL